MNGIFHYIQDNDDKGLVFIPSEGMVVDSYMNIDFPGLWGHDIPQYPDSDRSRNGFC